MTPTAEPEIRRSARRDPEHSKRALIAATLDTIAEIGISDTTVSRIITRAGLSRGMIHLHFGGKSQLLAAAAKSFGEIYYDVLETHIRNAGNDPESVIMTVVRTDLGATLLNERSARIWHAFRGSASTNDGIALYSSTRDKRLRSLIRSAFEEIVQNYGAQTDPDLARDATFGLLALLEGMWVDYLSNANSFSRDVAVSIIRRFLAGLFPAHFQGT